MRRIANRFYVDTQAFSDTTGIRWLDLAWFRPQSDSALRM
jgi:hypothetical protein